MASAECPLTTERATGGMERIMDTGLLIVRLVIGLTLAGHGLQKALRLAWHRL